MFQLMLRQALSKWGYEVVTVSDGEEALRAIMSKSGPQFAILDWMMPKVDGLEVCRRVRGAKLPGYVYIILLTAKQGSNLVPGAGGISATAAFISSRRARRDAPRELAVRAGSGLHHSGGHRNRGVLWAVFFHSG
jgi:CheY-like chemotaxis protein